MWALVDDQPHAVVRALLRRRSGGVRLLVYRNRHAWHDLHGDDLSEALRRLSGTEITDRPRDPRPVLTRLGEHGDVGRPATHGAVEAAVLDLLQR
ncbi:hypothetical protein [Streptomyces sp. NRRL S-646]|uniref:hypothetical protein n=1 Tax=Streptomyces sp. NRRL S-646 TaxID=1463917 RepID=UPI000B07C36A|nr:hypothetical protein [Streptomyces sp. NRRL S-646]